MRAIAVLVAGILLVASAARADPKKDWDDCASNDAERSIAGCTNIIKLGKDTKPNLAIAYANRGNDYLNKGDYAHAISDYTQSLKLKPDADVYNNRGASYDYTGEYDLAIADYDQAIKLKPDFADAVYNRGNALARQGRVTIRPSPTTITPSSSNRTYADAYNGRGNAYATRATMNRPSPISIRPSSSIPISPRPIPIAARPISCAVTMTALWPIAITPSASSRIWTWPMPVAPMRCGARTIMRAPSRATTKRSRSRAKVPGRRFIAPAPTPCPTRASSTSPSPATTRRSASIPRTRRPFAIGVSPAATRVTTIKVSPISNRRFSSTPTMPKSSRTRRRGVCCRRGRSTRRWRKPSAPWPSTRKDAGTLDTRGEVYLRKGLLDLALADFDKAASLDATLIEVLSRPRPPLRAEGR